jgi:aspartyl-tRNA(Asn)/glutamyl-tRNA(Gln) amidotransferase subunit B
LDIEPVIGFEIHTELKTRTKVFCGCSTAFGAPPNTQVCPVCLGLPGVLPVLNRRAVEFTIRTATALNCEIAERTSFDRKNYYYPDLPKNYQISQNYNCLGRNGWFEFAMKDGSTRRVRINNVHLEEDAGKLLHPEEPGANWSIVDLNRTGVPLIEIVTEPDLHSLDEAQAFMAGMRSLLRYIDVSDCKMEEGSLRFEANISVRRRGDETLGPKVEIKNLNSTRVALKCIEYEVARQSEMLGRGERVAQETRLWDEAHGMTQAMRSKEFANDYRYFPEPDLVPILITSEWREEVARALPELPSAKRGRFVAEHGLPDYDAGVLTADRATADYFETAVRSCGKPKQVSNWVMTHVLGLLNERGIDMEEFPIPAQNLARLVALVEEGVINQRTAKNVFDKMIATGKDPRAIVEEEGLVQISDTSAIEALVDEVIAKNTSVAEDYRSGKDKAKGRLVGEVMKASKGKANPAVVNELIDKRLRP